MLRIYPILIRLFFANGVGIMQIRMEHYCTVIKGKYGEEEGGGGCGAFVL